MAGPPEIAFQGLTSASQEMDDLKLKVLNSNWKGFSKTSKQLPPLPHDIPPHLRRFFAGQAGGTVKPYKTSTAWWIVATGFPLLAGTFGPIANLFSVCALVQTWRIDKNTGERISDPKWLLALNAMSLAFAVIANIFLLLNFARRVRYYVAQFVTITLWYISAIFLLVPFAILTARIYDKDRQAHSQSYYYALIAGIIYATISTFLLLNVIGASNLSVSISGRAELHVLRQHYNPSFRILSIPQRGIMLQTISFVLYVALMAGVYSAIEGWSFVDAVYWVDYTLLTVGLGSDFTLQTELGRFLLIPFSLFGFILLGLVVNSVRSLLIERAREKRRARNLITRREKWQRKFDHNVEAMYEQSRGDTQGAASGKRPAASGMQETERLDHGRWLKKEFELMRHIETVSEMLEKYSSAAVALFGFMLVWIGGSLVFWSCERDVQGWTYPNAIYFSYVSITTIGFGDFYPSSTAGKPFFVLWSLIAVPSVTALIGGAGDTVASVVENGTTWFWKNTILPEPQNRDEKSKESGNDSNDFGPEESSSDAEDDEEVPPFAIHSARHPSRSSTRDDEPRFRRRKHVDERHRLILKLSKEMVRLVTSLTQGGKMDPSEKRYTWDEWQRWLTLLKRLNEREQGAEKEEKEESVNEGSPLQGQVPRKEADMPALEHRSSHPPIDSDKAIAIFSPDNQGWREDEEAKEDRDRAWLWLSDQGPLFSQVPEPVWIMEKLNDMLEKVVLREEESLREGDKDAGHRPSSYRQEPSSEGQGVDQRADAKNGQE
ncbi:potassium channel [Coprinopsis sp. MPI-PUGE-AT-0042]|nr:potassium channel [Coprinopsis sp. MPI-PUGE-AT-0042]